jgi:uncharacterized protein (TIGR00369 family)
MVQGELSDQRREQVAKFFTEVPFADFMGFRLESLEYGVARVSVDIRANHKRNQGVVHGGVITSLADTAAAMAVSTVIESDERTATIELSLQFLKALFEGRAEATAEVLRLGRRVVAVRVDVRDSNLALIGTALCSFLRSPSS